MGDKPKKKMSALEAKLAQAKKAKEEAEKVAAEKAAADAVVAAEQAAIEAAERAKQEEAQRLLDEQKKAEEQANKAKEPEIPVMPEPATEEEAEKLARMMSTMYGDEAFDEDARPDQDENGNGEESLADIAKKGGKLSNRDRRRLAKEQEAKEREVEYQQAMMKASAEGAQFAVSQTTINPDDPQWQNALDIVIPNFSISARNKELFVNAELTIAQGRRYGLVGPNGAGKSTLLKMIARGELKVPPRVDYLYVEQEVMADDTPAVDAVLKADKERWNLLDEEKQILKALEKGANDALDVRLGEIHEQLAQIGASSQEARARRILFGLGFDGEMQMRPTKFFSGGWRMRISLARALFIEPTLLMLDEPTNHLDLNAVIWLDDYLQKWKKTLLVVSHDQDFLNSVCQEILHLEDKKVITYKGNYDTFKEQEATRRKQLLKDWEKQEKKLKELKAKGITKENAEKEQIKAKSREPGARANKKQEAANAATGGVESAESQVKLIARPREYTVVFSFPEVVSIPPPILEVRDVNFRYKPNLPWLFKNLNFGLDMGSRVCIVGPNGSGKSTIIKLITEEVNPPEGEVRRNPRLRIGVYNQHFVDRLPMEEDPVSYLRRLFNEETYQSIRNKLGKYGLEGHAHTIPIRDLSGGQKARVVFAELSLMAPHLLFLDEPTNNLDIESIDALCDALKAYNGGVVMVSHDARLIETVECQLWVVEEQNVTPWQTGFDGYRKHLLKKLEDQLAAILPGSGERPKDK
jgi:ATP-binding cassette subfamily F protein 1